MLRTSCIRITLMPRIALCHSHSIIHLENNGNFHASSDCNCCPVCSMCTNPDNITHTHTHVYAYVDSDTISSHLISNNICIYVYHHTSKYVVVAHTHLSIGQQWIWIESLMLPLSPSPTLLLLSGSLDIDNACQTYTSLSKELNRSSF